MLVPVDAFRVGADRFVRPHVTNYFRIPKPKGTLCTDRRPGLPVQICLTNQHSGDGGYKYR